MYFLALVSLIASLHNPTSAYTVFHTEVTSDTIAESVGADEGWRLSTDDVTVGILYATADMMNVHTESEILDLRESHDLSKFDICVVETASRLMGYDSEVGDYFLSMIGATELDYSNEGVLVVFVEGDYIADLLKSVVYEHVAGIRFLDISQDDTTLELNVLYDDELNFDYLKGYIELMGYDCVKAVVQ